MPQQSNGKVRKRKLKVSSNICQTTAGKPSPGREPGLTIRMQRFIDAYIINPNATKAAVEAGYSKKSAPWIGNQLLRKTLIFEQIQAANKLRSSKYHITAERVLLELARIAFGSLDDFLELYPDGTAEVTFKKSGVDERAALSQIEQDVYMEGRGDFAQRVKKTKIRMHDKSRALDMLGKHLKLFGDGEGFDPDADRMSKAVALRKALREILLTDGA